MTQNEKKHVLVKETGKVYRNIYSVAESLNSRPYIVERLLKSGNTTTDGNGRRVHLEYTDLPINAEFDYGARIRVVESGRIYIDLNEASEALGVLEGTLRRLIISGRPGKDRLGHTFHLELLTD